MLEAEEGYIYTNNPTYNEYLESDAAIKAEHGKKHKNPMIETMRKRINAYYRVLIKNLRDLAPKNIKYSLIVAATK